MKNNPTLIVSCMLLFYFFFIESLLSQTQTKLPEEQNKITEVDSSFLKMNDFPQVDVIGRKPALINRIPGSANIITEESLQNDKPLTGNEMLKKVTGINVVDEEGAGLRANIGIRGLDPDRSRNVLMMEDGIPIALAPYGEPEMYYTPAIDRMKSIEVLKGSGSILYGPQTIGGVINYITYDPPLSNSLSLKLRGGDGGFFTGQAGYGSTIDNVGFQFGILHKQADRIGITRFDINDLTAKIRFQTGEKSRIGIKLAFYDENSNSTYVGLTQSMFDNGDYYTIIAPNDELDVRRYSASLTHDYFFSESAFLRTTVYGYTTTRNWLRQDFSRTPTSNMTGIVWGDTSVTGGAIYMRNSTGNRNRQFEVAGVEPRFNYNYNIGNLKNELEGGFRFHYERALEQRIDGQSADAKSGNLREDEIRTGYAESIFAQNRIFISSNFTVIPGIRIENFHYERDIFRIAYTDTSISNNDNLLTPIPGIGFNYNFNNDYSIFAGVHRGYAPPRIKDAITNDGTALNLDAELSWNYEAGIRASIASPVYIEFTGFLMDFSNQVIPVSASSGGSGTGLVNGGETMHIGAEAGIRFDFHQLLRTSYIISLTAYSTYVNSTYSNDRFITIGNEKVNVNGNKLPYSPEFMFTGSLDFNTTFGLGFNLSATYVSEQFTDELNTNEAVPSGETGLMPSFITTDITANYLLTDLNSSVYFSVKNLMDERYIASRRP
ncbi:MAG: TonB-dependent receptor plug domain-containing protein, partial [Ignavibacteriaceae bacterium]|nr:TonB-dependent receptor plug domain-containing protein [Ignavibacteriaceae bacterium]